MNRTAAASLSSIALIVIYFGLAVVYQSCGKKETPEELTIGEKAVQVADTYTQDSYFEEEGSEESPGDPESDPAAGDLSEEDKSGGQEKTSPPERQQVVRSASTGGRYLVVAGNYLVQSNAESMVSNLKNAGYSGAETTVFDLSQYYTVLAGRYDNRSTANSASARLKELGIDNYVLTKK